MLLGMFGFEKRGLLDCSVPMNENSVFGDACASLRMRFKRGEHDDFQREKHKLPHVFSQMKLS